ncbi:MAG: Gfo/Idh/MocA family oxidoreductase [Planctomycetales bacterium]|nr:Gfo/Idh/MocA family oxidoreductase [Planctomycetales bacterium]
MSEPVTGAFVSGGQSDSARPPRRAFLRTSATALAVGVSARACHAETEKPMVVAVIGVGGMGMNHVRHLAGYPQVEIAAVCDVDANRLALAAAEVENRSGRRPATEQDLRKVLADDRITAVFIATPDHWHTPAALLALEAGKHVYVEKPCCHNIREGRLLVEAARRTGLVVQTGTQSRSSRHVQRAMELLRDGAIGDVLVAKAWNSQRRADIGRTQPSEPPRHLDYDLWVGPAPMRPYRSNMLPAIWRWWHDFGCGDMGNDGVHDLDLARWGLGVTEHPVKVAAMGGKYFFEDDQQFPDTQNVLFEYRTAGRPRQLVFEQRIWSPYKQEGYENGNAFYGTKGLLVLGKIGGFHLYGARNKLLESMEGQPDLPAHHQNFFACIRSGERPAADAEIGHLSAALCHLGNIAIRTDSRLEFDSDREQITNHAPANELVRRDYREHWSSRLLL